MAWINHYIPWETKNVADIKISMSLFQFDHVSERSSEDND